MQDAAMRFGYRLAVEVEVGCPTQTVAASCTVRSRTSF